MKVDGLLISMCLGVYSCFQTYTILSSFFPQYAVDEYNISQSTIGFIFGCQSLANFISSLFIGKYMTKYQIKRKALMLGMAMQGIFVCLFITLEYIPKNKPNSTLAFFLLAVFFKLGNGIGMGLYLTPIYSYLPIFYPDKINTIMTILNFMIASSFSLGPLLGGLLYQYLSYASCFFFSFLLCFITLILQFKYAPHDHELQNQQENQEENQQKTLNQQQQQPQDEENVQISYLKIFSKPHIIFILTTFFLSSGLMAYCEPTFATYAQNTYEFTSSMIGYVFFTGCLVYVLLLPLANLVSSKFNKPRIIFSVGAIIAGFGMQIVPPALNIPKHQYFPFIGFAIVNAGAVFIWVPVMTALIEVTQFYFPELSPIIIGDISSSLYNSCIGIGQFIGPTFGGLLVNYYGFAKITSFYGILLMTAAPIYLIFQIFNKITIKEPQPGEEIIKKPSFQQALFRSIHSLVPDKILEKMKQSKRTKQISDFYAIKSLDQPVNNKPNYKSLVLNHKHDNSNSNSQKNSNEQVELDFQIKQDELNQKLI